MKNMPTSVELREERAGVIAKAREIQNKADSEGRDLTAEEEAEFDRLWADAEAKKKKIDRMERLEREEENLEVPGERRSDPIAATTRSRGSDGAETAIDDSKLRAAYRTWLKYGEIKPELRQDQSRLAEYRDTVISTDTKGGYLIAPVQVTADLVKAITASVWIRQLATVTRVTDAKKLGIRRMTSGMSDANWTTEIAAITEDTSMAFDRRDLEPQLYTKLAKVSQRTLMLASDIEGIVRDELSYRAAITEEKAFLTGDGVAKPLGVFTASVNGISTGRDVVAGTATAPTSDGLIDVKYTLKEGYLRDASTRWIFHRDAIKQIRKLKNTTTGDYVWSPGITTGDPDRILDIPFHTSEFAPNTFTTGLYFGVLGTFRFYRIAEVIDLIIQRLVELYAATNEVGFKMMRFVDGAPILEEAFVRAKLA